ncbi:hypothetical protein BU174_11785 [Lactococcus cremoris]|nr:hypothetical protein [Lactococcus cremoris]MCT4464681.1 hypothetical protein [Lactococcus cremoris]TEA96314.1 hypothetical protein BU174_11785 [Lactococcus cremoris]TKV31243.1 hypothetical protein FDX20_21190 [Citrobacter sp. TBCS-11]
MFQPHFLNFPPSEKRGLKRTKIIDFSQKHFKGLCPLFAFAKIPPLSEVAKRKSSPRLTTRNF